MVVGWKDSLGRFKVVFMFSKFVLELVPTPLGREVTDYDQTRGVQRTVESIASRFQTHKIEGDRVLKFSSVNIYGTVGRRERILCFIDAESEAMAEKYVEMRRTGLDQRKEETPAPGGRLKYSLIQQL